MATQVRSAVKDPLEDFYDFKNVLANSMLLSKEERGWLEQIPESVLENIFKHNFKGDLDLAKRVMLNNYKVVDAVDSPRLIREKRTIKNLSEAVKRVVHAMREHDDILFLTDFDNDGSLAQTVALEFVAAIPKDMKDLRDRIHIEYASQMTDVRGFTLEVVDRFVETRGWGNDRPFLIVTADNGINNQKDAERILAKYPNASLIVTDHHLPNAEKVKDTQRSLVLDPQVEPTEYFRHNNISGCDTLGVLLTETLRYWPVTKEDLSATNSEVRQGVENIRNIGRWANLLDYANASLADMPLRPYLVERALTLRPLLNVSNSMANLVTSSFQEKDIHKLVEVAKSLPSGAEGKGLDEDWINGVLVRLAGLNDYAGRLLRVEKRYRGIQHTGSLYEALAVEVSDMAGPLNEDPLMGSNPNWIEQLRPFIFQYAIVPGQDKMHQELGERMQQVFSELRNLEKEAAARLRTSNLVKAVQDENSIIVTMADPIVAKFFSRRLLGKVYNRENPGFILTLDVIGKGRAKGSLRSMFPMTDILKGKEVMEAELGISVSFRGHEQAAGFTIAATPGTVITEKTLESFNHWVSQRVATLRDESRLSQIQNVEVDISSMRIVDKINRAVRANLAGMWSLPAVLSIPSDERNMPWITDPETAELHSLREAVSDRRFGYQSIATDFKGGALIAPVELLRGLLARPGSLLRLDSMDDGVLMASAIVDGKKLENRIPLHSDVPEAKALERDYKEQFASAKFIPIPRETLQALPYFRMNLYSKIDFKLWEKTVIGMLDRTGADSLSVFDTEGTGLGKAPKCFNFGAINLSADTASGQSLSVQEFNKRWFKDSRGNDFLLTEAQVESLVPVESVHSAASKEDAVSAALARPRRASYRLLYPCSLETGVVLESPTAFKGKASSLLLVDNFSQVDDEVKVNRQLAATGCSFLVNEKDIAIPMEFEHLTGISNNLLDSLGQPAEVVDKALTNHYRDLRRPDGSKAKVIFQAHNLAYDHNLVHANFPRLAKEIESHLVSDTMNLSRQGHLGYDTLPVSFFEDSQLKRLYFYDSPASDYSLSTFFRLAASGMSGVYPDTKAQSLLRYDAETEKLSLISREDNQETELPYTLADLVKQKRTGELPGTAVRYSVEFLSSRMMVRNIILYGADKPRPIALHGEELKRADQLRYFQKHYHFDASLDVNIANFANSVGGHKEWMDTINLTEFGQRFLAANRALQARFHDGWIYSKVLSLFEPDTRTLQPPQGVVKQINYFTDLPERKIRQVWRDTVLFKRRFGLTKALVHEQHNNLRFMSPDGQGLADVVYESVLPQMLAVSRYYSPYNKSVEVAVDNLLRRNVIHTTLLRACSDVDRIPPRDSWSFQQLAAFHRDGVAPRVKAVQEAVGSLGPIEFKLSVGILPMGSFIIATPKRPLSQVEVGQAAEVLERLAVLEKMRNSVVRSGNATLTSLLEAQYIEGQALRDRLLENFESVHWTNKQHDLALFSEWLRDSLEGGDLKELSERRMEQVTPEIIEIVETEFVPKLKAAAAHLGMDEDSVEGTLAMCVSQLKGALQWQAEKAAAKAAAEAKKKPSKPSKKKLAKEGVAATVPSLRTSDFLPDFPAYSNTPLRFGLKHLGISVVFSLFGAPVDMEMPASPLEVEEMPQV